MSRLLADLVIALGIVDAPLPRVVEIREPEPKDPPRLNDHGMPIFVIAGDDPRLPDLIRRMDAARLSREVVHLTGAQMTDLIRPVDETPALPPPPDMARLFEDPPVRHARGEPQSKRPPAPKPKPRRWSSWWIRTPEERAEKSRGRNRK